MHGEVVLRPALFVRGRDEAFDDSWNALKSGAGSRFVGWEEDGFPARASACGLAGRE